MAIDPAKHQAQIHAISSGRREYECPGCGKRTTDKDGRCQSCQRVRAGALNLERYSAEQLKSLAAAIRAEVERRRKELDEVEA